MVTFLSEAINTAKAHIPSLRQQTGEPSHSVLPFPEKRRKKKESLTKQQLKYILDVEQFISTPHPHPNIPLPPTHIQPHTKYYRRAKHDIYPTNSVPENHNTSLNSWLNKPPNNDHYTGAYNFMRVRFFLNSFSTTAHLPSW